MAYWYQSEPHAKFPPLPDSAGLTIKPIAIEPLKAAGTN